MERESGATFFTSGDARQLLRDAGVPTVDLYTIDRKPERRFFGVPGTVEYITVTQPGWLLETFAWRYITHNNEGNDSDIEAKRLTVLPDLDPDANRAPLMYVDRNFIEFKDKHTWKLQGYILRGSNHWRRLNFPLIAERVKKLAAAGPS